VYPDEDRQDLELLKTAWLIEEFEQNYRTVLSHLLTEAIENFRYLEKIFFIGELSTWKICQKNNNNNKIIAAETCFYYSVLEKKNNIEKFNTFSYKC